ncbi:dynein light chain, putative [Bodo saltans]|uniref:Dynein light chain n=1 Tax=Bodo saltans TaxID=75058 RepID=A0A0S4J005_BODSA|nr:dynein light chain, putative [Bodo saltans]|eukprot:CUG12775.1 dynein light chain, putative [Bodo saltans]
MAAADLTVVIKESDMTEDMQTDAINVSIQALAKFNIEKHAAAYIKKEFDAKYNPTWVCQLVRNFNHYRVTPNHFFIYFYLGDVAILLYKPQMYTQKIGLTIVEAVETEFRIPQTIPRKHINTSRDKKDSCR